MASITPTTITTTVRSSHRKKLGNLWNKEKGDCAHCWFFDSCRKRDKKVVQTNIKSRDTPPFCYQPENKTNGLISDVASKKMRRSIEWMFAAAETKYVWESKYKRHVPWRINFLTLTIKCGLQELNERGYTDTKLKSILNAWLTMAKTKFGLKSFVWKAETQKRGVLHFHITSDCYMNWRDVRKSWNRLLMKHGLEQVEANSTDIHAVVDYTKVQEYLIKYFNKNEKGKRVVQGRLWSRSYDLSRLRCQVEIPEQEMTDFHNNLKKDITVAHVGEYDYATTYYLTDKYWDKERYNSEMKIELEKSMRSIRSTGKGSKDVVIDDTLKSITIESRVGEGLMGDVDSNTLFSCN